MTKKLKPSALVSAAVAACMPVLAQAPADADATQTKVIQAAAQIADELSRLCPVAGPADQAAFDKCRAGLFRDSRFKRSLQSFVLWGRQRDPAAKLVDTKLTQFGPDVLAGMYVPLFMFNGQFSVNYVEREKLYQIRLETAFRNGLPPGQFPYPFWHEAEKWGMYEKANDLILWWDPKIERVKVAQFTMFGGHPPIQANAHVTPPAFDGQWRWTDAQGRSQPTVTVFDGLFRADNPYIGKLDSAYKSLALRMRESQCMDCHVPNNPDGSKRLVLLQTPMHAASEIKRLMKSVRDDRMPRDELGIEKPLDDASKAALLTEGAAFERLVDLARQWEAGHHTAQAPEAPAAPGIALRSAAELTPQ
ncbi:hypothetical protein AACH06_22350 [Ideonella sp. DXS29W]|uniref:Cytochrome c domain-containing protein n=1 Tax=Ideonella lacteola TaxID=2984193 RepID=A0ABU9BXK8_9BURK